VTGSPVPSCWKIPIPVKVSGLADESICFVQEYGGKSVLDDDVSRAIGAWKQRTD
jgi:hypothetical protein